MSARPLSELTKGFMKSNPVFVLLLGLCPTLAVSTTVNDAIGMALAATFVLVCSNVIISLTRDFIPDKVRIPCFIVVIATFVTVVELVMQAYLPPLYKSLGIFVPLIVVNCIILGRAEAFASKNTVLPSLLDGLGMGLGFGIALLILSTIREVLGNGSFLGYRLIPGFDPNNFSGVKPADMPNVPPTPALIMILAPGAFLCLGLILGFISWRRLRKSAAREGAM
ncbi:MAG: electron transport complex subunit E [Verrucomicrobia bacterium]|nr:electron transport complex subunit E [Verrucomicrobiota bacterium]